MNLIKVLKTMWPEGIPPADYEKLASLFSAEVEHVPPPPREVTPAKKKAVKAPERQPRTSTISTVLAHLATGEATCPELSETTGLAYSTVCSVINQLVKEGHVKHTRDVEKPNPKSRLPGTVHKTKVYGLAK